MANTNGNKSILIVDDDAAMLRALEKVLRDEGWAVIPALAAAEAVEILMRRLKKVDLVITDLRMPFIEGTTLLYAIHKIFPSIPVIILTAFGNPDIRAECLRHGAAAFLEKPMDSERLLAIINGVLDPQVQGAKTIAATQSEMPGNPGRQ